MLMCLIIKWYICNGCKADSNGLPDMSYIVHLSPRVAGLRVKDIHMYSWKAVYKVYVFLNVRSENVN